MPASSHLILQMPQSNGGAALRTRSDDSSFYDFGWIISGAIWAFAACFLLVLFCILRTLSCGFACNSWPVWDKLVRAGWRVEYRVKNGFRKVYRLVCGRKAAPQVIASEQQTAPESIEMHDITVEDIRYEYDSPEDPPDYEYYGPPEEPLPVYKR